MTSEERKQVLELARKPGLTKETPRRHTWIISEDEVREGKRYTCAVCGSSIGPKETSIRGFNPDEDCWGPCP